MITVTCPTCGAEYTPSPQSIAHDLIDREPRLRDLLAEARALRGSWTWQDYADFKQRLETLAGWHAHAADELLATSAAYDTALDALINALGPLVADDPPQQSRPT